MLACRFAQTLPAIAGIAVARPALAHPAIILDAAMQTDPTIDPTAPANQPFERPNSEPCPLPDTPPDTDPLAPGSSPEDEEALRRTERKP